MTRPINPSKARPKADRPFTVLDGMILVAAAAVGLAVTRWFDPDAGWWEVLKAWASKFARTWYFFTRFAPEMLLFPMPTAVSMTLGVLALRLRKPRPRWRTLARQPGWVACLALVLSWAVAGGFAIISGLSTRSMMPNGSPRWKDPSIYIELFGLAGSLLGGFAVVVAWSTLWVVGRWRPQPTWLDRLGRLTGLAWVALAPAGWFVIRSFYG